MAPTKRVAMLMAELAEMEHGDEGRAREWMTRAVAARRDPAWTADGFVSDRWMPVSPVTGRLDAFQWKDPLAGVGDEAAVIENDKATRALIDAPPSAVRPSDAADGMTVAEAPSARRSRGKAQPSVPVSPSVIPLMHVPDDPGPEPELPLDPEPDPPTDPSSESWRKLRGLFK
jgi:HemY protein